MNFEIPILFLFTAGVDTDIVRSTARFELLVVPANTDPPSPSPKHAMRLYHDRKRLNICRRKEMSSNQEMQQSTNAQCTFQKN